MYNLWLHRLTIYLSNDELLEIRVIRTLPVRNFHTGTEKNLRYFMNPANCCQSCQNFMEGEKSKNDTWKNVEENVNASKSGQVMILYISE